MRLSFFDLFKPKHTPKKTAPTSTWRKAANESGYGIKLPPPDFPIMLKICTHLDVPEKTREKLDKLLKKHYYSGVRLEGLVNEFLQITKQDEIENLQFPVELVEVLATRRGKNLKQKEIIAAYIRHEQSVLRTYVEITKFKELKIKEVKVRSCQDSRVCSTCQDHNGKVYKIYKSPKLPMCWECRCYYEAVI